MLKFRKRANGSRFHIDTRDLPEGTDLFEVVKEQSSIFIEMEKD